MADLNDRAGRWLCSPWDGRILVQGEVGAVLVIKGKEASERPSKGPFIPHDHVIETLPPQRPDQALHERILPRRPWRDQDFLRAETLQQPIEVGSVAVVAIPHQIRRGGLVGKRVADLLARPRRRRMVGDIHMNDPAAVVGQE